MIMLKAVMTAAATGLTGHSTLTTARRKSRTAWRRHTVTAVAGLWVVYVTATAPYILLTVLLIRSVTLPGAEQGVLFYITPDFARLTDYNTLASFNQFHTNLPRDCVVITVVGEGTSVYAGFAVFSILGYLANQSSMPINQVVSSGPGLAFMAYPEVISLMPLSQLWAVLFFLMLITLVIDSQLATCETLFTILSDQWPRAMLRHGLLVRAAVTALLLTASLLLVTQVSPSFWLPRSVPPACYPGQSAPPAGYPGQSAPPAGYPGQSAPPAGYPGQSAPPAGYPGQSAPPAGYPGQSLLLVTQVSPPLLLVTQVSLPLLLVTQVSPPLLLVTQVSPSLLLVTQVSPSCWLPGQSAPPAGYPGQSVLMVTQVSPPLLLTASLLLVTQVSPPLLLTASLLLVTQVSPPLLLVTQGGVYVFQLVDWYIGSYTTTIIALLECIVIGWVYGVDRFGQDVEMMIGRQPPMIMKTMWKYVLPVFFTVLLVVTLATYEAPSYGDYRYDMWATVIGWFIAVTPFIPIPAMAVTSLVRTQGSLLQRLKAASRPEKEWGPSQKYRSYDLPSHKPTHTAHL
ncbi:hypothetical protein ACOMHN_026249 [Nucella lapillus]